MRFYRLALEDFMNSVFIFGAGASQLAGAPLMADFLDCAEGIGRALVRIPEGKPFQDVSAALSDLQSVHSKSYLDLDNIETLFSAVEMGQLIGRLAGRDESAVNELRASLVTVIVKTIQSTMRFPFEDGQLLAPEPYNRLGRALAELRSSVATSDLKMAFLTFNYDLGLDVMLHATGGQADYWLTDQHNQGSIPLLKLHGSINWGTCSECGEIVPIRLGDLQWNFSSGRGVTAKKVLDLADKFSQWKHCNKPISGPPVLVPPTWNKTEYQRTIGRVWRRAAIELADAENIFVIGYSLPETDSFFRYLFALGSESKTRIKNFVVINPDPDGQVETRFRALTGRGIEHRLQFWKGVSGKWENSMSEMIEIVKTSE